MMLNALLAVTLAAQSSPDLQVSTSQFAAHYATLRAGVVRASAVDERYLPGLQILGQIPRTLPVRVGETERQVASQWILDPLVFRCTNMTELRALTAQKPPQALFTMQSGETANYLSTVLQAMTATEAAHRAVWPAQYDTLKVQLARWKPLEEKSEKALAWLTSQLGYESSPAKVEVVLLPILGWRDGIHSAWRDNFRVMVVADQYSDSDLAEVILREIAVGLSQLEQPPFFKLLEQEMLAEGLEPQAVNQARRAVFLVFGGEAVKRNVDPGHIHVGENYGLYNESLKPYADSVMGALPYLVQGQPERAAREIAIQLKSYEPSR